MKTSFRLCWIFLPASIRCHPAVPSPNAATLVPENPMNLMKLIKCLLFATTFFTMVACKKEQVTTPLAGLEGTWLLTQKQSGSGSAVQSIPSSPKQTITFTYPNDFKTSLTQDTSFTSARYFNYNTGDLIAPNLTLLKTLTYTGSTGSFYYFIEQDVLTLTSLEVPGPKLMKYTFRRP